MLRHCGVAVVINDAHVTVAQRFANRTRQLFFEPGPFQHRMFELASRSLILKDGAVDGKFFNWYAWLQETNENCVILPCEAVDNVCPFFIPSDLAGKHVKTSKKRCKIPISGKTILIFVIWLHNSRWDFTMWLRCECHSLFENDKVSRSMSLSMPQNNALTTVRV